MIPLVMVLKQEDVNNVTMKSDGIDLSSINSKEGEYEEHGNSFQQLFSNTEDNTHSATFEYVIILYILSSKAILTIFM